MLTLAVAALLTAAQATTTASAAGQYDNLVKIGEYPYACRDGGPLKAPAPLTLASGQCQTDNAGVSVYMDSNDPLKLEAADKADVTATMENEYGPTALAISFTGFVGSGSAETDIVFQEGTVGNGPGGTIGYTWCNDAIESTFRCDQMYVRMEASYSDRALSCHEAGHAIGLTHGADAYSGPGNSDSVWGCLRTPYSYTYTDLGTNQVDNINAEW